MDKKIDGYRDRKEAVAISRGISACDLQVLQVLQVLHLR